MKKLLSVFLSFSLIFSLIMGKNSFSENQIVFAESANSISEDDNKVEREFWPMLKALVGMTLSYGLSKVCAVFGFGFSAIMRVFSSIIDLFTNYKAEKIKKLEEEKQQLEESFLRLVKILNENEYNRNYVKTLLNGFLKAKDKVKYINGLNNL